MILTQLNNNEMWVENTHEKNELDFETRIFQAEDALKAFNSSRKNPSSLVYIKDGCRYWEIQGGHINDIIENDFYSTILEIHEFLDEAEQSKPLRLGA